MATLLVCVLVIILVLYVPGYCFSKALGLSFFASLFVSPLLGFLELSLATILFCFVGLKCDAISVSAALIAASVLFFAIGCLLARRKVVDSLGLDSDGLGVCGMSVRKFNWSLLFLYLTIGLITGSLFFLASIQSSGSFFEAYDNGFHMSCIRGFVDSGVWSTLNVSRFLGTESVLNPFDTNPGFYPAAWHTLCAFVISATGASVATAISGSVFFFCFVAFPLSICFLLRCVFSDRPIAVLAGSVVCLAFVAFPWSIITFGPLYPNLVSFCLAPVEMTLFLLLLKKNTAAEQRLRCAFLFLCGGFVLMVLQPNTVFTCAVFLAPYCVYWSFDFAQFNIFATNWLFSKKVFWGILFTILIVVLWIVLLNAPMFSSVLSQEYPAYYSKVRAFANGFTLSFRDTVPQIVLAIFVVVGGLKMLVERRYLWMLASYLIAMAMYTVNCSTAGPVKIWLTGFWYSDVYRIAAMVAMLGIPLAAFGIDAALGYLAQRADWRADHTASRKAKHALSASSKDSDCSQGMPLGFLGCSLAAIALLLFMPTIAIDGKVLIPTPMGDASESIKSAYSNDSTGVYSYREKEFVDHALDVIPEGSVVVNLPDDGTMFAYGNDGLRTIYRDTRTYDIDTERSESREIREHLDQVSTRKEVQDALNYFGAHYLILLDQGEQTDDVRSYLFTWDWFKDEWWTGINSVSDETPGFEVVLDEGDMRLYRITALG